MRAELLGGEQGQRQPAIAVLEHPIQDPRADARDEHRWNPRGLGPGPSGLTRIVLTPCERAEIIVSLTAGETVTLRSYPQNLGVSASRAQSAGAADELDILQLTAAATLRPSPTLPARLGAAPALDPADAVKTRSFELGNNHINGKRMDMSRIDATITVDTTEVWDVVNMHSQPHNFHIHDVQFQILSINGVAPPPGLAGWKDTVYTPPAVSFRLIMRFSRYTNPVLPYMYHCHLLWHEDQGMMGQFVVVDGE
ncbi:multicopper oxidase domain-containing protein [Nocardia donostiensis]|uniref:multicopper oxidase domain-containing protein n=1 Tax=Nocardia donostiensis TaxID=1538463 RepID=UPI0009DAC6BD|nr:multicopper oxidase domain-containing protein [Nocardia donostiensis]